MLHNKYFYANVILFLDLYADKHCVTVRGVAVGVPVRAIDLVWYAQSMIIIIIIIIEYFRT